MSAVAATAPRADMPSPQIDTVKEPTPTQKARCFMEDVVAAVLINRIPQLRDRVSVAFEPSHHYIFEIVNRGGASAHVKIGRQFEATVHYEELALAAHQVAFGLTSASIVREA